MPAECRLAGRGSLPNGCSQLGQSTCGRGIGTQGSPQPLGPTCQRPPGNSFPEFIMRCHPQVGRMVPRKCKLSRGLPQGWPTCRPSGEVPPKMASREGGSGLFQFFPSRHRLGRCHGDSNLLLKGATAIVPQYSEGQSMSSTLYHTFLTLCSGLLSAAT